MIMKTWHRNMWNLLAESFLSLVSNLSQPFRFLGELICVCVFLTLNRAVIFSNVLRVASMG